MQIAPKPYINRLKLRNHSYGKERRRNWSKKILEHSSPFPKSVEYKDIDIAFKEFVEKELDISYDGDRLPTYTLFSNQKIGEYSQTWEKLDEMGNLIMNFKTITRENDPQKGTMLGNGDFNIP